MTTLTETGSWEETHVRWVAENIVFTEANVNWLKKVCSSLATEWNLSTSGEDLFGEVAVKAVKGIREARFPLVEGENPPLRAWLRTIAVNARTDVYRRERRTAKPERLEGFDRPTDEPNPEATVILWDTLRETRNVLLDEGFDPVDASRLVQYFAFPGSLKTSEITRKSQTSSYRRIVKARDVLQHRLNAI